MRRLFLRVYSDNEHYDADCSYAYVEVTEELIERIKARQAKLAPLLEKDENGLSDGFAHASWWDYECCFLENADHTLEEAFGEDVRDRLLDGSPFVEPHTFAPVEFSVLRTEGDKVVMDETCIWWEASPKHGSITLTTDRYKLTDLITLLDTHELEKPWDKNSSGSSSKDPTS